MKVLYFVINFICYSFGFSQIEIATINPKSKSAFYPWLNKFLEWKIIASWSNRMQKRMHFRIQR